jgi:3-hydroxy-3-methylglutaryl CoA synthase
MDVALATTIAREFALIGDIVSVRAYGNGHINDTYLVETTEKTTASNNDATTSETSNNTPNNYYTQRRYILQRINSNVFPQPDLVMSNVIRVCYHMRAKLLEANTDVFDNSIDRKSLLWCTPTLLEDCITLTTPATIRQRRRHRQRRLMIIQADGDVITL